MSARSYRRGIAKHQLLKMNPHSTNEKKAGASSSMEDGDVEGATDPGPARRVTPASGERLSARRRDLGGKEHKPLTVKIVKPEEKPLMSQNQSSLANNVLLLVPDGGRDSARFQLAKQQPDELLHEPSISPYQNSLTERTPESDALTTASSSVTPSGHQPTRRHWGKLQE